MVKNLNHASHQLSTCSYSGLAPFLAKGIEMANCRRSDSLTIQFLKAKNDS